MLSTSLLKSSPKLDMHDTHIKTEHFTLKNGMEVIIIPNDRVPAVLHMLWYKVGGIDEKLGKTGLAHYLEHLMFHGTKKFPKDEIDKRVSSFGGSHNAFTSYDFTAYYQNVPKEYLGAVMEMEADRMRNLVLEKKQTKIERNIVLEERLMRRDNSPNSVLSEKINEAMFGKEHPYGRPLIGYEDDIENLTHEDALAFYNKYYFPNNTVLVLAGDIDAETAKPLIDKYYAPLEKGPELEFTLAAPVTKVKNPYVEHSDKTVSSTTIKYSYLAPDLLAPEKDLSYALNIISFIAAGNKNSILYKKLVTELDLALGVSASYSDMSRGQADFRFSVTLKDPKHETQVTRIIEETIQRFKMADISDEAIANAKNLFLIETLYSKESYKSLAYIIGMNYTTGISLAEIINWDERISEVTKGDIAQAAEFVFQDDKLVVGKLLPAKGK